MKHKLYTIKEKRDEYDYQFHLIDIPEFLINNVYEVVSVEEVSEEELKNKFDEIDLKYIIIHSAGVNYVTQFFDEVSQHYGLIVGRSNELF